MSVQQNKIKAIIREIWSKLSVPKPMSGDDIVSAIDDVFDAGKQAEYDAFWDAFQQNGALQRYEYAFSNRGWNDKTFRPKYDMTIYGGAHMFKSSYITDLEALLKEHNVNMIAVEGGLWSNMFEESSITVIPELDTRKLSTTADATKYLCLRCADLVTIRKLILRDDGTQKFNTPFFGCSNLKELYVEGTIGQNGFGVGSSPLLTHDSLMSIINALKDYSQDTSGTSWVLPIGTKNQAKLTDAEKAIATGKGWTLA